MSDDVTALTFNERYLLSIIDAEPGISLNRLNVLSVLPLREHSNSIVHLLSHKIIDLSHDQKITRLRQTPVTPVSRGAELIAAERERQQTEEGWTPKHDAEHAGEGLALAACCYAVPPQMRKLHPNPPWGPVPTLWPWRSAYWKPCPDDRVRELVKAGALIAAEIDRLQATD